MGDAARAPGSIMGPPQGGGAVRGIGETFAPDLQTGTGNLTVPIVVPSGRRGLQPRLELTYSTGHGAGLFGLGWTLALPQIARKTSDGVPLYDDERDTFVLAGAEDLVPVERLSPTRVRYRPRVEGLYAQIVHHRDPATGDDYWEVAGKDGLTSTYGTPRPAGADPAVLADPDPRRPGHVAAWRLTETRDTLGNVIAYRYRWDEGDADGHRWRQPLPAGIDYADRLEDGTRRFLATVTFDYASRDDPSSAYRTGFEVRTTLRCTAITTAVHVPEERKVRRYDLRYRQDPYSGVSLLAEVAVAGFDGAGQPRADLPPLTFGYTEFDPLGRRFTPVGGPDAPLTSLAHGDLELVDCTGDGLPDVIELNGTVRYWRNLGGTFDRPRSMAEAPAGLRLADPGVQLLDADGDGRADLFVTTPALSGYFPLRFGGAWGRFRRHANAPSFGLDDPRVRLLDLDGDGTTDALRADDRLTCFFNDRDAGWSGPRPAPAVDDGPTGVDFADPRIKTADLTGDGLQDLVLVNDRGVAYWPNLGRGRFGARIRMTGGPVFPAGHDPRRLILGDVDGDGLADLVYVGDGETTVWINRGGNGWSPPLTVPGCPRIGVSDSLRVVDLLGVGVGGVLWSRDASAGRPAMYFLNLAGAHKPRLLCEIDNHIGAVTRIGYQPSSRFSLVDERDRATRWKTPLPFVVPVVTSVQSVDAVSGGKLTSVFRYRHGYWDGREREFRGFGCVDQLDTETFDGYHEAGLLPDAPFRPVERRSFCPPRLTRTWFHLGPVDELDDPSEVDHRDEYWSGDPGLLDHAAGIRRFLRTLPGAAEQRDALRALRGRVLRTEMYGRDGTGREDRPYSITEHAYTIRPEEPRVFAAFEVAQRISEWERGDDPLTRFTWTTGHDAYGQPRRQTTVAPPRRSANRRALTVAPSRTFVPDRTTVLAQHTRTDYAEGASPIKDRVAEVRTYEPADPPAVEEDDPQDLPAVLAAQVAAATAVRDTFETLAGGAVVLLEHTLHHYDGPAYDGLPLGQVGEHGLLTRTERLVLTDQLLDAVHEDRRPDYLGGTEPLPAGAPAGFGAITGYTRRDGGWYADAVRQAYDVQLPAPGRPARGLVLGVRDPLGNETTIQPDGFWLLPASATDPAGLVTAAEYDYRAGQARRVVDPNGHATCYRFHPLGMLTAVFLEGRNGEGGTAERPEVAYRYDLSSWYDRRQPISVHTTRRVRHPSDLGAADPDEVVESREYSDGWGRVIQQRLQTEELTFEASAVDGPATGTLVADRVVVSGWQVFDNKGQVVERYEPFFDAGWLFQPEEDARRGRVVSTFRDPRGRIDRILNPDGSQRLTVYGDDQGNPSPWTVTGYDENDMAPHSSRPDGTPLGPAAPASHHDTPATTVLDALGRTICQVARCGPQPGADWHAVRTEHDGRGNVRTVEDQLGRIAYAHAYDLADRPVRVDNLDAGTSVSVFDAAGNLLQIRDSRDALSLRTYDLLNRHRRTYARDRATDDLTLREVSEYGDGSAADQPVADRTAARDANRLGRLWRQYDGAGRLTVDSYDFTGNPAEQAREVIGDDAIAAAEPAGWTADWADARARGALDPVAHRTTSRFDALGRATEILAPVDVTGHRARITPDYARSGALRAVAVDDVPFVRLLAYDAHGRRVLAAYGNGLVTRCAYDPDTFRLTALRTAPMTADDDTLTGWTPAGAAVQDHRYAYDLVGNLGTIDDRTAGCGVVGSADGPDRLVRTFDHDPLYRLVSATGRACASIGSLRPLDDGPRCGFLGPPAAAPPAAPSPVNAPEVTTGYREQYTYDPVGNLLDLLYSVTTGTDRPSWHRRYGYAGLPPDQWADASDNHLTSVHNGGSEFTSEIDVAGHLTGENEDRRYTWDHAGRLIGFRVSNGNGTSVAARYLYDVEGRRVKKWVRRGGNGSRDASTIYVGNLVEQHRWYGGGANTVLQVLDGDARIAQIRSGPAHPDDAGPAVQYTLGDHLGSVAVTADDTGGWLRREEYFPYGETSFGGFSRKRYRFTGRERDEESGLSYHLARYYEPAACRWVSCDPAGLGEGPNPYRYCRGSPLRFHDPSGLQGQPAQHAQPQAPEDVDMEPKQGFFESLRGSQWANLGAGIVMGTAAACVPFIGAAGVGTMQKLGYMDRLSPEAQAGVGIGMAATGIVQAVTGVIAMFGGGGLTGGGAAAAPVTGGVSLIGSAIGLGAVAVGALSATAGVLNVGVGAVVLNAGMGRAPTGKPQWWLRNVRRGDLARSQRGYQVYVLKDRNGKVLYVGKSGGAGGKDPGTWVDRVRAHIRDTTKRDWIGEVDQITVTSDLTEMESFAMEENLISLNKSTAHNISPGEFTTRFPGSSLADNASSAAGKPTVTFETDIVAQ
ncbi:SpvB/TcaC N-terminal domain-containing protein [Actinoplanes sp. NPDC049681]|uniref:SpvB/TcaC N-terminal domain-containing protein n=1 Tax=Actinoplanes sp. NPDC049681 TaxID=3363905 RepID=UPI0037B9D585